MANVNFPAILGNYTLQPFVGAMPAPSVWFPLIPENNWRWYLSFSQQVAGTIIRLLPKGGGVGAAPALILSDSQRNIEFRFKDNPTLATCDWWGFCTVATNVFIIQEIYNQTN